MNRIHVETPLLESLPLSNRIGRHVWLKMEASQPCASFKARGIGFICQHHAERGCQRFITSSGGNAGLAVAYAGRRLGIAVTVVVPKSTPDRARRLIQNEAAEVIVEGQSWQEAHKYAQTLVDKGSAYVHPFDDPLIWRGHASLIEEVAATDLRPDAVVLSVGGGGLLCGIAEGLANAGWTDVTIVTAETAGAESFYESVRGGELVTLPKIRSIAATLGAKKVTAQTLVVSSTFKVIPNVVTDAEAVEACLSFADDHRVIVEPACGASLALLYKNDGIFAEFENVLVIVCGGAAVSYRELLELRETLVNKS